MPGLARRGPFPPPPPPPLDGRPDRLIQGQDGHELLAVKERLQRFRGDVPGRLAEGGLQRTAVHFGMHRDHLRLLFVPQTDAPQLHVTAFLREQPNPNRPR